MTIEQQSLRTHIMLGSILPAVSVLLLCGMVTGVNAQTFLLDNVEFFDAATGKKVKASNPQASHRNSRSSFRARLARPDSC
jgi:hypothetical protein